MSISTVIYPWPPASKFSPFTTGDVAISRAEIVSYEAKLGLLTVKYDGYSGLFRDGVGQIALGAAGEASIASNLTRTESYLCYTASPLRPGSLVFIARSEEYTDPKATTTRKQVRILENGVPVAKNLYLIDNKSLGLFYAPFGTLKQVNQSLVETPTTVSPIVFPIALPPVNWSNDLLLRVGYADLTTAPELISITEEQQITENPILRSSGTIKKGQGHKLAQVRIPLTFATEEEVHGLAQLLRQLKHTPFLPVENQLLNNYDIDALAVTSIAVSTTEGMPGQLTVELDAVEFDWRQYFPDETAEHFTDLWCWPLFKLWCESDSLVSSRIKPLWDSTKALTEHTRFKTPRIDKVRALKGKYAIAQAGSFGDLAVDGESAVFVQKNINKVGDLVALTRQEIREASPKNLDQILGQVLKATARATPHGAYVQKTYTPLIVSSDKTGLNLSYIKAEWKGQLRNLAVIRPHSNETILTAINRIRTNGLNNTVVLVCESGLSLTQNTGENLKLTIPKEASEQTYISQMNELAEKIKAFQNSPSAPAVIPSNYYIVADVSDPLWRYLSTNGANYSKLTTKKPEVVGNVLAFPDNEEYWDYWDFDWTLESFSAGFSKIIAAQQARSAEIPALQTMGGTDVQLHLAGTVFSQEEARRIKQMLSNVNQLALVFQGTGLGNGYSGFMKIENELALLLGVEYVLPMSFQTQTTPSIPGDLGFTLTLIEYNPSQSAREAIEDEIPDAPESLDDSEQYNESIIDRLPRLRRLEENLQKMELYPDIDLPTNIKLNSFISMLRAGTIPSVIREWDTPDTKLRMQGFRPGGKTIGYAEPDFYVISQFALGPDVNKLIGKATIGGTYRFKDSTGLEGYMTAGNSYLESTNIKIVPPGDNGPPTSKQLELFHHSDNILPLRPNVWERKESNQNTQATMGLKGALDDSNYVSTPNNITGSVPLYGPSIGGYGVKGFATASQLRDTRTRVIPDGTTGAQPLATLQEIIQQVGRSTIGRSDGNRPLAALNKYESIINSAATANNIDPAFIKAVIHTESDGNPNLIGPITHSGDRAVGLMQLMTETAQEVGVSAEERADPVKNINGATRYIAKTVLQGKKYGSHRFVAFGAAEFNAGPYSKKLSNYANYGETASYGRQVFGRYLVYRAQYLQSIISRLTNRPLSPELLDAVYELSYYSSEYLAGTPPLTLRLEIKAADDYTRLAKNAQGSPISLGVPTNTIAQAIDNVSAPSSFNKFSVIPMTPPLVSKKGSFSIFDTKGIASNGSVLNPAPIVTDSGVRLNPGINDRVTPTLTERGLSGFASQGCPVPTNPDEAHNISDEGFLADHIANDKMNRLVLAFPSYCVLLIDGGRWLGFYRFYDRMFGHYGVSEIEVYKTRQEPMHEAQIVFSNMYGKLTAQIAEQERSKAGDIRWTGPWFGQLVENFLDPKPDEFYLQRRAQVINSLMLRPGARLHLRMGYGSDGSELPIAFNGTIVEVPTQEGYCKVIAFGDGNELFKEIPATNNDSNAYELTAANGGGKDPRTTILELLSSTSENIFGDLAYRLSRGKYSHNNAYGIENFGRPLFAKNNYVSIGEGEIGVNLYEPKADPMNVGIAPSNVLGWIWSDSDVMSGISVENATPWKIIEVCRKMVPDFMASVETFDLRSTLYYGKPWWPLYYGYDLDKMEQESQRAKQSLAPKKKLGIGGDPAIKATLHKALIKLTEGSSIGFNPGPKDGPEVKALAKAYDDLYRHKVIDSKARNQGAILEQKRIATKELSDKIDSGWVPDKQGLLGEVVPITNSTSFMKKKTFQQLRLVTSNFNLLENKVDRSKEDLYTAAQFTETANLWGHGEVDIPSTLRYFDSEIYTENIRIKTGHSGIYVTSTNTAGEALKSLANTTILRGPINALAKANGGNNGGLLSISSAANENVTLSELKDGLKSMYRGGLLIRGDASYRPFNLIHLMDERSQMAGLIEARSVLHRMTMGEGFTTVIEPDLCVSVADPYQVHWWIAVGQTGAVMQLQRLGRFLYARQIASLREGRILGTDIATVATKLKKFTDDPELQKIIDTAAKQIQEGGLFKKAGLGRSAYTRLLAEIKAKAPTEKFALLKSSVSERLLASRLGSASVKALNLYEKVLASKGGVYGKAALQKASTLLANAKNAELLKDGSKFLGTGAKMSNIIGLLMMVIGVDTLREIFDRKLGARKSALILPLRLKDYEFVAGIDGHHGGVVGDASDVLDQAIRSFFNLKKASSNLGKVSESGDPEAIGYASLQTGVSGLMSFLGIELSDGPEETPEGLPDIYKLGNTDEP